MKNILIRIGQIWQAKGYAVWTERTVIIREVNGQIIWVELKDGQKVATNRQLLTQDYRLLTAGCS